MVNEAQYDDESACPNRFKVTLNRIDVILKINFESITVQFFRYQWGIEKQSLVNNSVLGKGQYIRTHNFNDFLIIDYEFDLIHFCTQ